MMILRFHRPRRAVVMSLALGLLLGATASVAAAGDEGSLEADLQKLRRADSLTLSAVRYGRDRAVDFETLRPCARANVEYSLDKQLDKRWIAVICDVFASCGAGAGSAGAGADSAIVCPPACRSDTTYNGSLQLSFARGEKSATVSLRLDSGIGWLVMEPGKPSRCIPLGGHSPEVLQILRDALGEKAFLSRLRICTQAMADSGAPGIPVARELATDGGLVDLLSIEALPEVLTRVAPVYPEDARNSDVSGTVMLQALVARTGEVSRTRVIHSIPALDRAAVRAVEQWKFKPAMSKGAPVSVWVGIPITFKLR